MDNSDLIITGSTPAGYIEENDRVIIDGDPIEVRKVLPTEDIDEVLVVGYSHQSGDVEEYPLYADDEYDLWSV